MAFETLKTRATIGLTWVNSWEATSSRISSPSLFIRTQKQMCNCSLYNFHARNGMHMKNTVRWHNALHLFQRWSLLFVIVFSKHTSIMVSRWLLVLFPLQISNGFQIVANVLSCFVFNKLLLHLFGWTYPWHQQNKTTQSFSWETISPPQFSEIYQSYRFTLLCVSGRCRCSSSHLPSILPFEISPKMLSIYINRLVLFLTKSLFFKIWTLYP